MNQVTTDISFTSMPRKIQEQSFKEAMLSHVGEREVI